MFTPHQFKEGAPNSIPQENLNQNQVYENPGKNGKRDGKLLKCGFLISLWRLSLRLQCTGQRGWQCNLHRLNWSVLQCLLHYISPCCTAMSYILMDFGQPTAVHCRVGYHLLTLLHYLLNQSTMAKICPWFDRDAGVETIIILILIIISLAERGMGRFSQNSAANSALKIPPHPHPTSPSTHI